MKKYLRKLSILLTVILILSTAFSPIVSGSTVQAAGVTVKKVSTVNSLTGSSKSVVVAKGRTIKLTTTVTVTPNKPANKKVTYKSLNPKIATVSAKGVIKGVKPGKTKVVVTSVKNPKKSATITVTVEKTAVTKVTITKPASTTLYPGGSLTLKAKASGKNTASKTLAWKTSNKNIATVTKNGLVKAIKTGSVKITAMATDGSGKKADIALKVVAKPDNTINLLSANVGNYQSISFKLSKPKALTKNDVQLYMKAMYSGTYRVSLDIKELTTKDNVNYTITIGDYSYVGLRNYVKVVIPSLNGTKEAEAQFNEAAANYDSEIVYKLKVNVSLTSELELSDIGAEGLCTHKITNLPAGLKYKVRNNSLFIFGTPTKPGLTESIYTAVDEMGNTFTKKVKFIVGSNTTIFATSKTYYGLCPYDSAYKAEISVTGGSGSYTYDFLPNTKTYGCRFDGNKLCGYFDDPGTYTIPVKVTDTVDEKITTTTNVTFVIKQALIITGIVKDSTGNPVQDVHVAVVNKNRADKYTTDSSATTNSDGTFRLVINSGTYDVGVYFNRGNSEKSSYIKNMYSQNFTESKSGFDITIPLYKVKISLPEGITSSSLSGSWVDSEGYSYGAKDTLYLLPGTYSLVAPSEGATWFDEDPIESVKANFTVSNKNITVEAIPVRRGTSKPLDIAGNVSFAGSDTFTLSGKVSSKPYYHIYSFKPESSTSIGIKDNRSSAGTSDIRVVIYNKTTQKFITSTSGFDESATIKFVKGNEYLIMVRPYSNGSTNYSYNVILTDKSQSN